jgi:lipid A 4'-phosphatase
VNSRLLHVPIAVWLIFLAASALLFFFPELDLAVVGFFYKPDLGFPANGAWYERIVYRSVEIATTGAAVGLAVAWIYRRVTGDRGARPDKQDLLYLLLVLLIGPALVVNLALKEHWGRARPVDLVEFGGTKQFSVALVPSDQGGGSFPSGHVAAATWLFIVTLLLTRGSRRWSVPMLLYCLIVGVIRMAAGGHFASDVLAGFLIVALLALALRWLMCRRREVGDGDASIPRRTSAFKKRRQPEH